jgi:hypothetical protein
MGDYSYFSEHHRMSCYEIIANNRPSITFRREIIQEVPTAVDERDYPGSFFVNSAHSILFLWLMHDFPAVSSLAQ